MGILKVKDWRSMGESHSLVLEKDNLPLWKTLLNETMLRLGGIENYSECLWDQNWLEGYVGMTPYQAVIEEIENWEG